MQTEKLILHLCSCFHSRQWSQPEGEEIWNLEIKKFGTDAILLFYLQIVYLFREDAPGAGWNKVSDMNTLVDS